MYSWDDYYEPSEFDIAMEELKQSIVDNVREELKTKIQMLEKENEELREIKANWKKINAEHQKAVHELNVKTENAEREAKGLRAKEILSQLSAIGYRPSWEYKQGAKCDLCDENRKIHFVSPMGREMTEDCRCAKGVPFYSPKEERCFKFYAGRDIQSAYFTRNGETVDYDTWELRGEVYKELPEDLDEINLYRAVFLRKEDCQKCCDWKNEKEREENVRKP